MFGTCAEIFGHVVVRQDILSLLKCFEIKPTTDFFHNLYDDDGLAYQTFSNIYL